MKISQILGIIVFIGGIVVMIGWFMDIDALKSIIPGFVTMKFTTALSFTLSGAILFVGTLSMRAQTPIMVLIISALTLVLALLMATLLISSLFGIETGIENLGVPEAAGAVQTSVPGRPSVGTMANFIVIVAAGVVLMLQQLNMYIVLRRLGIAILVIGGVALVGYVLNVPAFYYAIADKSSAMALHTALLFMCLGCGLYYFGNIRIHTS